MTRVLVPLFSAAVRSGGSWRVVVGRRNAGAAHGHRHVLLRVDGAAPRTARSAAQHDRGQQHGCTAEAEVLLPARPGQAAPAQAVGLRQEPRVAAGVVGQPAERGGISASLCSAFGISARFGTPGQGAPGSVNSSGRCARGQPAGPACKLGWRERRLLSRRLKGSWEVLRLPLTRSSKVGWTLDPR